MNFSISRRDSKDKLIVKYIRNIFGFNPKNIELYKIAFTHRSSSEKNRIGGTLNNERLEYLGDAVLSAVVADFLFKKFPLFPEGPLTEIRSKIVCRDRLNQLSEKIGLSRLITIQENIHAKSASGDAFEALVGAMYLDQGYVKTRNILIKKIILTHLDIDSIVLEEKNFKSKIISWSQKNHKKVEFTHTDHHNHSHKKLFKASLFVNGKLLGEGLDYTIKKAEQIAAQKAWEWIQENDPNGQKNN
mgnify:CR=1 FL=1